jgi:TRAP-type mannitol/chloroaromatic compound transport system permease small subunit
MHSVDRTNELVGKVVSMLMVPMIFVMVYEVVMRYGLKSPTIWGTEMSTFIFAWYILLGGGYTLLLGAHVNMNALHGRLSLKKRAIFDVITSIAFFIYCGVLLKESCRYAWETIEMGRRTGTDWNPPLSPALIALPIGIFLMLLQGIVKFIRDLAMIAGKEASK